MARARSPSRPSMRAPCPRRVCPGEHAPIAGWPPWPFGGPARAGRREIADVVTSLLPWASVGGATGVPAASIVTGGADAATPRGIPCRGGRAERTRRRARRSGSRCSCAAPCRASASGGGRAPARSSSASSGTPATPPTGASRSWPRGARTAVDALEALLRESPSTTRRPGHVEGVVAQPGVPRDGITGFVER